MSWDITGMAAVASIGTTPEEIFDALCLRRSGIGPLRAFDAAKYRTRHAYEIDDRGDGGDRPFRATRWLHTVVEAALADAGMAADTARYPVMVGTTLREHRSAELWWREAAVTAEPLDPDRLDFAAALRDIPQVGEVHTIACACAASLCALGMAADSIELGLADTVIVAGTDSLSESAFGTIDRVQTRTPDALRPFDTGRAGMIMGESAVAVVLRRAGAGGRHARLRGVGMNCDALHATAPDPLRIRDVIADAHQRACVDAADIDLVMLHGSGTQLNDAVEASVLTDVFGAITPAPAMTAIKSMTGHTLGGSGLLSLIVAAVAMRRGTVPPILGLTDPIAEAATLNLIRDAAPANPVIAQIDAFGFGGINAVAVIEKGTP
ncbi:beta-ketoacyl synthase N-terminal-like domain-containing protein [Nocardia sp. BMG111209]|uniref:beta-ketoacyl synthase N-terminal-like domain-containing protein n=1 Tax=Nocardia sp. BMG111209 TaxID=1160137 RepID=UPI00039FB545|nr:beta-ketoacyl synthase N-terminal-like domain-containing protein [Nocardia sp. BMG111209]